MYHKYEDILSNVSDYVEFTTGIPKSEILESFSDKAKPSGDFAVIFLDQVGSANMGRIDCEPDNEIAEWIVTTYQATVTFYRKNAIDNANKITEYANSPNLLAEPERFGFVVSGVSAIRNIPLPDGERRCELTITIRVNNIINKPAPNIASVCLGLNFNKNEE